MDGRGEVLVAAAAFAALGDAEFLARLCEIVDALAGGFVVDNGAHGHLDLERCALGAGALAAFAVASAFRLVFGVEAELEQGVGVLAAHHDDVAAAAAIAAAGAAPRDVLLPAEGEATVAAIAGLHENSYFIYEHRKAAGVLCCRRPVRLSGGLCACLDVDELAHPSAVLELHHAGDLGEQGIVLAPTDVGAGLQFGAALAHDDAAARYQLAAEDLDAQPLGSRIAPVLGTA